MINILNKFKDCLIIIGLGCLCLAFFLPNTSNFSSSLFKEFFAVLGFLFILTVQFFFLKKIVVPSKLFILFILFIFLFIQYVFNLIINFQDLFFNLIYISIFFLSIIFGLNSKKYNNSVLIHWILFSLIFSALVSFLISLNQKIRIIESPYLFCVSYNGRATANLGQPNQLSTLTLMAFFSLFYLKKYYKINKLFFYTIIISLIFCNVLTQSRSAWLSVILISTFFITKFPDKKNVLSVFCLNLVFWLSTILIPFFFNYFYPIGNSYTTLDRMKLSSSRFDIWPQLFLATFDKPFLGYGAGQVGLAQIESISNASTRGEWFTYSHNIFLDFVIWYGWIVGSLVSFFIISLLIKISKSDLNRNKTYLFIIILVFFFHCLLEYPYSYFYFLIPIGIISGFLLKLKSDGVFVLKKIYLCIVIFLSWLLFALFTYQLIELDEKKESYSLQYLFKSSVKPIQSNLFILDGYSEKLDIEYLDYCYLIKNRDKEFFRRVAYRYPSTVSVSKYYSTQSDNLKNAENIVQAYQVISNRVYQPNIKKCNN
ncbi:hypothetical protein BEN76_11660 [Acinetobacter soli]|uniref:O-antigen ligase-related domain-containing protein n=2 Tax=Acinetobacter soli TaxID=487316 RepID=A0A1P8EK97_9GAMM|nr:hypothetical protein BEN76_11660 [Acinetobacter soli]